MSLFIHFSICETYSTLSRGAKLSQKRLCDKQNSPNIVYCFHNEIIEITLEDYLKENPDKTEPDFAELKALSDQIYYEQDRAESAQTRKDVSIHGLEETEHCAMVSIFTG